MSRRSLPVGDCVVRLQPAHPAERTGPELREPDRLQIPHPQSHHAGSAHVLPSLHLLFHHLIAGWLAIFFIYFPALQQC